MIIAVFYFFIVAYFFFYLIRKQISNRASLSYIGAVAEYKPVRTTVEGKNPSESNVKNYLKFIKKASEFVSNFNKHQVKKFYVVDNDVFLITVSRYIGIP